MILFSIFLFPLISLYSFLSSHFPCCFKFFGNFSFINNNSLQLLLYREIMFTLLLSWFPLFLFLFNNTEIIIFLIFFSFFCNLSPNFTKIFKFFVTIKLPRSTPSQWNNPLDFFKTCFLTWTRHGWFEWCEWCLNLKCSSFYTAQKSKKNIFKVIVHLLHRHLRL